MSMLEEQVFQPQAFPLHRVHNPGPPPPSDGIVLDENGEPTGNRNPRLIKESTYRRDAVIVFDSQQYPIRAGETRLLPHPIALHGLKQFPWLQMSDQPVTARYEEPVEVLAQDCKFPGCDFATNDFAAFAAHVQIHANELAAKAVAAPERPIVEEKRGPGRPRLDSLTGAGR